MLLPALLSSALLPGVFLQPVAADVATNAAQIETTETIEVDGFMHSSGAAGAVIVGGRDAFDPMARAPRDQQAYAAIAGSTRRLRGLASLWLDQTARR